MNEFSWRTRVYWEDTDGGGVVYYANYLKFMERARTEWLRSLGHSQHELAEQYGFVFAVAEAHVNYRKPARLDDESARSAACPCRKGARRSASSKSIKRGRRRDRRRRSARGLRRCQIVPAACACRISSKHSA